MKFTTGFKFSFDACFEEEGSRKVVRFDLALHWRVLDYMRSHDVVDLLSAESCHVIDDDEMVFDGIPLRWHSSYQSIYLGRRPDRRRIRITLHGNGGNMYWETFFIKWESAPHMLNFLRRHTSGSCAQIFAPTQWDGDFVDQVWNRRRSLDCQFLREWSRRTIREQLKSDAHRENFAAWKKYVRESTDNPGLDDLDRLITNR